MSSLHNEFYEGQEENWINFASEACLLRPSQSTVSWTPETRTAGPRRLSAPLGGISPGAETQRGCQCSICRRLRRSCCSLCCSDLSCPGCRTCLCRSGPVRGSYDGLVAITCLQRRTMPRGLTEKLRNLKLSPEAQVLGITLISSDLNILIAILSL